MRWWKGKTGGGWGYKVVERDCSTKTNSHRDSVELPLFGLNFPLSQTWHCEDDVPGSAVLYRPSVQSRHLSLESAPSVAEYFPRGHDEHDEEDAAPSTLLYLPRLQLLHCEAEVAAAEVEYLPAAQSRHEVPEPAPYPTRVGRSVATGACERCLCQF